MTTGSFVRDFHPSGHLEAKCLPCCFLRHITVKSVANAEMTTKGTVMATALIGPAHGECT